MQKAQCTVLGKLCVCKARPQEHDQVCRKKPKHKSARCAFWKPLRKQVFLQSQLSKREAGYLHLNHLTQLQAQERQLLLSMKRTISSVVGQGVTCACLNEFMFNCSRIVHPVAALAR